MSATTITVFMVFLLTIRILFGLFFTKVDSEMYDERLAQFMQRYDKLRKKRIIR